MKQLNWIIGPMAVVLGMGLLKPGIVLAQGNAAKAGAAPVAGAAVPSAATPKTAGAGTLVPLFIWDAQSLGGAQLGAQVGAWGNGVAQSGTGNNGNTLTATVRNLEEGVRFDLKKPVDIAPYRATGFWRLRVRLAAAPGGGGRGRNRGGNAATGGATATGQPAPLTQLRLKVVLDNGAMSGVIAVPQSEGRRGRGADWQNLFLPLRNMVSTRGASGLVRRLILTGDSTATFGIEQVGLIAETRDITATVRRSTDPVGTDLSTTTLKPGRSATLVADVNGGTSDVVVLWNFNADNNVAYPAPVAGQGRTGAGGRGSAAAGAARQGAANQGARAGSAATAARRIDAIGTSARPNWPNEENDYRVEVTIIDRAGKKAAVKKSFQVQVRAGN